jgi:hypothetical protein
MNRYLASGILFLGLVLGAHAQTATLTASASSYSASGGTVTFTAAVVYPSGGTPSSIGFLVNLPAGWSFVSQSLPSGANASAAPTAGNRVLEWAFSGFPASQLQWSFVASYTSGLTGDQTISVDSTQSTYRPGGVALNVPSVVLAPRRPVISSSGSASCVVNTGFSYTITATESAGTYEATGLPAGLTLSGNVISGTPATPGTYTITLRASNANGWGDSTTLTLTVGSLPEITSALTASGTVGSAFSYSIAASNSPTSYSASGLPSGLSIDSSTGRISGTPDSAGTANVTINAENAVGSGSATLVITIAANPNAAPTISSQPSGQTVDEGATVTFSVNASGATSYQWRKDGSPIAGATRSSYTVSGATTSDAGVYTVVVSNAAQSVTSSGATLVVRAGTAATPVITSQPASRTVFVGGTASFSVSATGSGLSYQWVRNGAAIAGATGASVSVRNCYTGNAGGYAVIVSNSLGRTVSATATLDVMGIEYFGTFANNAGTFAIYIRPDRTGVFIGYVSSQRVALVTKSFVLDENGNFKATSTSSPTTAALTQSDGTRVAAAQAEYVIEGAIGGDGSITGSVGALGLSLSAPPPTITGASATIAGFYESGASGTAATSYTIVSAGGEVYVATISGTTVDTGKGTVDANGNVSVTTVRNTSVKGTVDGEARIALTATPAGSTTSTEFSGGNPEIRPVDRLNNVSTRATAGSGDATLIVGFAVKGSAPKKVLIRGVGPKLASMGVSGVIQNPLLKVFIGIGTGEPVAQNSGWTVGGDPAAIAAAAKSVGAFELDAGSKDAALLIYMPPGSHTVHLTTTDGATGIGLIEVYEMP